MFDHSHVLGAINLKNFLCVLVIGFVGILFGHPDMFPQKITQLGSPVNLQISIPCQESSCFIVNIEILLCIICLLRTCT